MPLKGDCLGAFGRGHLLLGHAARLLERFGAEVLGELCHLGLLLIRFTSSSVRTRLFGSMLYEAAARLISSSGLM